MCVRLHSGASASVCVCVRWTVHSLFELCFYPGQESVTNTQWANYPGGKEREGGVDCHGNQVEHDCSLLDADRVHDIGQWVGWSQARWGNYVKYDLVCHVYGLVVSIWMKTWLTAFIVRVCILICRWHDRRGCQLSAQINAPLMWWLTLIDKKVEMIDGGRKQRESQWKTGLTTDNLLLRP